MAFRIYLLPMADFGGIDGRSPKYITGSGYDWSIVDYGAEDVAVALVHDPSQVDHDSWVANPDCMGLPEDLDQLMPAGAVTAAQNFFSLVHIPGQWVNTSRTYRETIRVTIGLFQFLQRWNGLSILAGQGKQSPFTEGVTLDTVFNTMSLALRQKFIDCFDTLQIDRSSLTGTSTIREGMTVFGQDFLSRKGVRLGRKGESL